MRQAAFILNYY